MIKFNKKHSHSNRTISYQLLLIFSLLIICIFFGCQEFSNNGNIEGNNDTHNYLSDITGTWKSTTSTYSFTINSIHVLFQYPNPIPPGAIVTYGNFKFISYDGSTVYIYDYDKKLIAFTAKIENDILSISGLNAIKVFDEPYEPRDYRPWNDTYLKQ